MRSLRIKIISHRKLWNTYTSKAETNVDKIIHPLSLKFI